MALIQSSKAPLLLLDDHTVVIGASASFCNTFNLDPATIANRKLAHLGNGEWDVPQLHSLLLATIGGAAEIDAYEMDLVREGKATCNLILSAHKLDYFDTEKVRVVLAATDVTETRKADRRKDDLVRDKQVLLQELQHRVANSLQIIASVLMQSARRVQSEETRLHLHNAHSRVMSIAMLQRQLAVSELKSVQLRTYFADLCQSISASMIDDPERITLETSVNDVSANSDVSVSMGRSSPNWSSTRSSMRFPNAPTAARSQYHSAEPRENGCCRSRITARACRPARIAECPGSAPGLSRPWPSNSRPA